MAQGAEADNEPIDVRQLLSTYTVQELNTAAEEYFARIENDDYLLTKPFGNLDEAPSLLIQFAKAAQGLDLLPGHHVLDFAAGSCWATRLLTQLGCKVYALDVSATALKIGERLFATQPVIGRCYPPDFLLFDGYRIPLPDETVDRIICLDAFHHVPNEKDVLREMARVLRSGGIAAFSEGGPHHSRTPQAQYEMRHFKVIERDLVMEEIWTSARDAGFTSLQLALFDAGLCQVSLESFERFLHGDMAAAAGPIDSMRTYLSNQRTFFLQKGVAARQDSRRRTGLIADLDVRIAATEVSASEQVHAHARVRNTSGRVWLPADSRPGGVLIGCHLARSNGELVDHDFLRVPLKPSPAESTDAEEQLEISFTFTAPPPGSYVLDFDLVSEGVCWFAANGSRTVRVPFRTFEGKC